MNNNLQVLPNNEYYQNFITPSASRVPLDTWEDTVSSINHPSGFRKFSDLQVESVIEDRRSNPFGIDSEIEIVVDVISESNIHCFFDFDDVSERTSRIGDVDVSREIYFENRILTDYFESVGNLVTTIDDISDEFNSVTRVDEFIDISNFDIDQVFNRVFAVVKDKTFTQHRQFSILSFLQDGSRHISMSTYSSLADNLVSLIMSRSSGWQVRFFPLPRFNSYDVTLVTNGLFNENQGIGTDKHLVGLSEIVSENVDVASGSQENIVSFSSTMRSAKVRTMFNLGNNEYQSAEINMIHNGTDVSFSVWGDMASTTDQEYGPSGIGTYDATIDGGNVLLKFTNNVGSAVTATSSVVLTSATATGVSSSKLVTSKLLSSYISIPSSGSPTAHGVGVYGDPYTAATYFVTVSNTTDGTHSFHEVSALNTDNEEMVTTFGEVATGDFIGTFGITSDTSNTILTFTPVKQSCSS